MEIETSENKSKKHQKLAKLMNLCFAITFSDCTDLALQILVNVEIHATNEFCLLSPSKYSLPMT